MSSFSDFKNKAKSSISDLSKALESIEGKKDYKDDRFWRATPDKSGNGYAVIRFLSSTKAGRTPFIKLYSHAFQGKNGWFIENCPTTIGGKCPVCEANSELWNSGIEDDKTVARDRKRKLSYIANIMVVSDPKNPSNDGKVFLFKFGKKIFDKIMEKLQPEFADETPTNVFDFWKGADFKLKIRKVAGYVNYDKSEFDVPAPLMGGDDKQLEGVWAKQHKLQEFLKPENFKSYDELSKKLDSVLKSAPEGKRKAEEMSDDDFEPETELKYSTPKTSKPAKMAEKKVVEEVEEEDAMSYFEKLTQDDE